MIETAAMKWYKLATCAYLILEVDHGDTDIIIRIDENVADLFVK